MTSLVSRETRTKIISFQGGDDPSPPQFINQALKNLMYSVGIPIPESRQASFGNCERIYAEDSLFERAFKEIYAPEHYGLQKYKWVSEEPQMSPFNFR